jgi:hypothetical protein
MFTECLVMRDALLDACGEVERMVCALQARLAALDPSDEADGGEPASTLAPGASEPVRRAQGRGSGALPR